MADPIRIEGLDALQKALADNPVAGKRAQQNLLFAAARRVNKGLEARIKRDAPVRSGRLRRSIRVYVPRNARQPQLIISGNRALVPRNAATGFMSRNLRRLPADVRDAANAVLQDWISRTNS